MLDLLNEYLQDGDRFARYVLLFPPLAEQVNRDLQIAQASLPCSTPQQIINGRDATSRLHITALNAGFEDAANVFYGRYEWFCRQLIAVAL